MGIRGPSRRVGKDRRWPALRLQALRRDGWRCVQCGNRVGLEVDHIKPVRDAPDLAFELGNLQVLCTSCHAKKTRHEMGFPELEGERLKWRNFLKGM
ncbi:MAG: HNH endonuclease signature motif containing protein [Wenzhouxiangella sp.]|nr:HNH endonuclease signature motif containing protein [Wenzhouxiangella sp.]